MKNISTKSTLLQYDKSNFHHHSILLYGRTNTGFLVPFGQIFRKTIKFYLQKKKKKKNFLQKFPSLRISTVQFETPCFLNNFTTRVKIICSSKMGSRDTMRWMEPTVDSESWRQIWRSEISKTPSNFFNLKNKRGKKKKKIFIPF